MHLRNYLCIALWVCFSTLSFAQPIADFDKANNNYRDGEYAEAAKIYEEILGAGLQSAELYYNLGNAYYKLNKLGPSIYYYEKGLELAPNNKDLKNNLAYAQQDTVDQINQAQNDKLEQLYNSVVKGFSSNTWAILAILSSVLAATLFILYYFTQKPSLKRIWFIGSLAFTLGIFGFVALTYANLKANESQYAIIWNEQVAILDGPTTKSNHIYYLHEGTKVLISYEETDWMKIVLEDGNEGWVQTKEVKKL